MWTSQVYGHHDKRARTKTQRTSQNTKYTKTFMCKHSLNTSLPLLKVSQVLKRTLFYGASYFHICMYYELKESCIQHASIFILLFWLQFFFYVFDIKYDKFHIKMRCVCIVFHRYSNEYDTNWKLKILVNQVWWNMFISFTGWNHWQHCMNNK